MSTSSTEETASDYPRPPPEGQVFIDAAKTFWEVRKLTLADNPKGFYLVHLCWGPTLDSLTESTILGPREFAKLVRERGLRPQTVA